MRSSSWTKQTRRSASIREPYRSTDSQDDIVGEKRIVDKVVLSGVGKMKSFVFALVLGALSVGCTVIESSQMQIRDIDSDSACEDVPENSICAIESDTTIVARCKNGVCVPFDCSLCPRLPCQTTACFADVCHNFPMPDGSACAEFPTLTSYVGTVGTCSAGKCDGLISCSSNDECPMIECVPTGCVMAGVCHAYYTHPGTSCEMPDKHPGFCWNYTCQAKP